MVADSIPLKRCSRGENCVHPDGPNLPATLEYFHARNDRPGGLTARCRKCRTVSAKIWNEANRERHISNTIRWQKDNPDRVKVINKRYSQKHSRDLFLSNKRWKDANKEKLLDLQRQRRRANPEKHRSSNKRHYQNHPEAARVRLQRRKTKKHFLPATFTPQDWSHALDHFHGVCAYCSNPPSLFDHTQVLHQDHFNAQNKGGGYTPDNIVPACQTCNYSKHDRSAEEWLVEYFGKRKAKAILERIQDYFDSLAS